MGENLWGVLCFLNLTAFKVIDFLYQTQEKDVTQKDIEKALVINRATTSKMLLLLEQKGFISRSSSVSSLLVFNCSVPSMFKGLIKKCNK